MELRQLQTFKTIAKLGSFVQAADMLGYSPSTITSHIQNLENEMGVKLFERLGHRIELTGQGRSLLPYAEQIIMLISEALKITANSDMPQGRLTIGTSESLGTYRLPQLLQRYREDYPKVEMVISFANCAETCDALRKNEIDVALIVNNRMWGNDLITENLSQEQMLFLASPNHPLSQKKTVMPRDLEETCIILTEPGCSYRLTVEKILKDSQVSPQSFLEANSIESIKQLMMLGLGIAMLPRFTAEKELAANLLCAIPWSGALPDYQVQMVYHKDKWLSPSLRSFLCAAQKFLLVSLSG
ncbi:MAG TPA: LysR family transcriptional regulator [Patescibacteria group bacterium]|nr:LysR family transcriptional regulator [Patescibacteria group bacterium]